MPAPAGAGQETFNQLVWHTPIAEVVARTAEAFEAAVVPHLAASVSAGRRRGRLSVSRPLA